jgi:hypothetical protein
MPNSKSNRNTIPHPYPNPNHPNSNLILTRTRTLTQTLMEGGDINLSDESVLSLLLQLASLPRRDPHATAQQILTLHEVVACEQTLPDLLFCA